MFNSELWQKPTAAGGTGIYDYQITKSLKFDGTSQALEKTWGAAESDTDKKAISVWFKRSGAGGTNSEIGSTTNTKICSANDFNQLEINTNNPTGYSDNFGYIFNSGNNANWSKMKLRDPSAWYHLVWIWNSDESTDTDRVKVYLNGESMGTINSSTYWNNKAGDPFPSSGLDTTFGKNGNEMHIARYQYDDAGWWGGQMADFIMIDGTASISDFGETKNGVWKPVDPSGLTFGNNGFWLKFTNTSNPGEDFSGNDNDFTTIGTISTHDFLLDTPTFNSSSNGGNFATYNPLSPTSNSAVFTEGNLKSSPGSNWSTTTYIKTTMAIPKDKKIYFEASDAGSAGGLFSIGVAIESGVPSSTNVGGAGSVTLYDESKYVNGTRTASWITTASAGDIIQVAVDGATGKVWLGINNTWGGSGNPSAGSNEAGTITNTNSEDLLPVVCQNSASNLVLNFGQDGTFAGAKTAQGNSDATGYGNFYYSPPTNFLALCAGNLSVADAINPAETDDDYPQKLFTALAYSGDDGGSQTTGFQPDFVWVKARNTSQGHGLWDSSRGTTKVLNSDANNAEATSSGLTAFGSTGYTMGTYYNQSGNTYVSWSWRANGGSTSSGSGDLTSTHQVDPSGGFSIVKAVGDGGSGDKTVTHGLSAAPDCILSKNLDTSYNWDTYWSSGMTVTKGLRLNTNEGQQTGRWGTINSSIMTCKDNYTWAGTNNYIYYCFRNIEGYIKVGNYNGNGESSDGTFVYTGFKPAFVMGKGVVSGAAWWIQDDATSPYNPSPGVQEPNDSGAMYTSANPNVDFLSNGFKVRNNNAMFNSTSYDPYVFLAVAHNPFKYATAR